MTGYHNPLGTEMEHYLNLLEKAGRYVKGVKGLFRELEACIPAEFSKEEALSDTILFGWDQTFPARRRQGRKYSELSGFVEFVWSEGIACHIPEIPRTPSITYVPYIFNETEWNRIIQEADNLAAALKHTGTDMPIVFPMLIWLLYSCGLRVSEALFLRMEDMDANQSCLTIRKAKRKRQRLVSMKESTSHRRMST